jgi:hypothetical protein
MSIIMCKDGTEPTIAAAVQYLERRYGIPASHIHAASVAAEVGQPIRITVTLFQQSDEDVTEHEITALNSAERVFLRSDGTYRTEPWHTPDRTDPRYQPPGEYSRDTPLQDWNAGQALAEPVMPNPLSGDWTSQ